MINLKRCHTEKVSSKETLFLLKMSINRHISFVATLHLTEGLCLNRLLTLKVDNSLISLESTRMLTVSIME
jgi:hypothetical protein